MKYSRRGSAISQINPAPQEDIDKIDALAKDVKIHIMLLYLHDRWTREKLNPSIAERCARVIRSNLPPEFEFNKVVKRPFGFIFTLNDRKFAIGIKRGKLEWNRFG